MDPPSPPNHTHPVSSSHTPSPLSVPMTSTNGDDEPLSVSAPTTSIGTDEGVPLNGELITEEEQSVAAGSSSSESGPETSEEPPI